MPSNSLKSLADKSGKSVDYAEKMWNKSKKIVKKQYNIDKEDENYWALVTGVTKKALGLKEENELLTFKSYFTELFNTKNKAIKLPFSDTGSSETWFYEMSDDTSIIIDFYNDEFYRKMYNSDNSSSETIKIKTIELGFSRMNKAQTKNIKKHIERKKSSGFIEGGVDGQRRKMIPSFNKITADGKDSLTGQGLPIEAFSVVKNTAMNYIKRNKPDMLIAGASNDEPSRVKLYKNFVQRFFGKKYDWDINNEVIKSYDEYKNPDITYFTVYFDKEMKEKIDHIKNQKIPKRKKKKKKISEKFDLNELFDTDSELFSSSLTKMDNYGLSLAKLKNEDVILLAWQKLGDSYYKEKIIIGFSRIDSKYFKNNELNFDELKKQIKTDPASAHKFSKKYSDDSLNDKGSALEVFSIVKKFGNELIKKVKPDILIFDGKNADGSRNKLYKKAALQLAKSKDKYKQEKLKNGSTRHFIDISGNGFEDPKFPL